MKKDTKELLLSIANSVPIGKIDMYAGATAPDDWLLCHGQAVSRETYAALFNVIGTTYGSGDGSTTFNVPDIRDRVPVGAGNLYGLNDYGGEATVTLETKHIPAHTHGQKSLSGYFSTRKTGNNYSSIVTTGGIASVAESGSGNSFTTGSNNPKLQVVTINATHTHDSVGGGEAHNNMQPYRAINFIIYAGGGST